MHLCTRIHTCTPTPAVTQGTCARSHIQPHMCAHTPTCTHRNTCMCSHTVTLVHPHVSTLTQVAPQEPTRTPTSTLTCPHSRAHPQAHTQLFTQSHLPVHTHACSHTSTLTRGVHMRQGPSQASVPNWPASRTLDNHARTCSPRAARQQGPLEDNRGPGDHRPRGQPAPAPSTLGLIQKGIMSPG